MYFDAVLNKNMIPVFNGTPEETKKWLLNNPNQNVKDLDVCIGTTIKVVSVSEYMKETWRLEINRRVKLMKFCPVCGKELEMPPISGLRACFVHGDVIVREDEIVFRLNKMV